MAITKIETVTVGAGGAASIDFTSIPGTYTDLQLIFSTRDTSSGVANNAILKINGVTTASSLRGLYGNGSSTASFTDTLIFGQGSDGASATANTFGNGSFYLANYALTNTYKSVSVDYVIENNASSSSLGILAGLWSNNSAITSLSVIPNGAVNFVQYSTASLYGIQKGSSGGVTVS